MPAPLPYPLLRRLLFGLDPEQSHGLAIAALRSLPAVPGLAGVAARRNLVADPRLAQALLGREFPNPVGLAAGFDKDAVAIRAMPALGFGFVEVGTVTPLAQAGNPKPRLFRHSRQRSLQNAMGFNNAGMEALARRLAAVHPFALPIGVNVGKSKATPPERALADYETLFARLADLGDYFVVNLSSPNTPGLRDLQTEGFVVAVLAAARRHTAKPVLVKIAPDLDLGLAASLAEAAVEAGAAGVVATNTTVDYGLIPGARPFGGLSGQVLKERSYEVLRAVCGRLRGRGVVISVGGIDSGAEAYRRIKAGARLAQIYTALVYQGPALPGAINRELLALMEEDGLKRIEEAVGAEAGSDPTHT